MQFFLTLKNHQQTQELDTRTEMAEGENYQLLLNRQANIFSVVAKDGRGELMRVRHPQQSWWLDECDHPKGGRAVLEMPRIS